MSTEDKTGTRRLTSCTGKFFIFFFFCCIFIYELNSMNLGLKYIEVEVKNCFDCISKRAKLTFIGNEEFLWLCTAIYLRFDSDYY